LKRSVLPRPGFEDPGAGLGCDRNGLDEGAVGQRAGHMDEGIDRADKDSGGTPQTDALGIRQTDRRETVGLDALDLRFVDAASADVAGSHERQSFWESEVGQSASKERPRIDVGSQIAIAHLDPDHIADRREAGVKQRSAQDAPRRRKTRRQKWRRAMPLRKAAPSARRRLDRLQACRRA